MSQTIGWLLLLSGWGELLLLLGVVNREWCHVTGEQLTDMSTWIGTLY